MFAIQALAGVSQHPAAIASSQPRGLFWNRKSMRCVTA